MDPHRAFDGVNDIYSLECARLNLSRDVRMCFIELLRAETCPASNEVDWLLKHAEDRLGHIAARLEVQWGLFESLAEPGFLKKFRREPHQHWWEMYLGSELVQAGLNVARSDASNGAGPDFVVAHDFGPVRIECVCPGRGDENNPDRVPLMVPGEARISPNDEMSLRIRRSIVDDKARDFCRYLKQGVIPADSRNIVAVSCSQLDHPEMDVMAASVLPIGALTVFVSKDYPDVEVRFVRRTEVVRQSGSPRSKTGFVDGTLSHIAGVVFYPGAIFNCSVPEGGLHLLRNQTAQHALPSGALPFVKEWPGQLDLRD